MTYADDLMQAADALGLELTARQTGIIRAMHAPRPRKGGKDSDARELTELTARLGLHVHIGRVDPGLVPAGTWCVTWQEGIKSFLYTMIERPRKLSVIYDEATRFMPD